MKNKNESPLFWWDAFEQAVGFLGCQRYVEIHGCQTSTCSCFEDQTLDANRNGLFDLGGPLKHIGNDAISNSSLMPLVLSGRSAQASLLGPFYLLSRNQRTWTAPPGTDAGQRLKRPTSTTPRMASQHTTLDGPDVANPDVRGSFNC